MASNGKKLEALTVFSHSIRYLKDKAIEIIREVTGDNGYNAMDIQWVLTVPAIWKPAAKQFMREAAYMVNNIQDHFLLLILMHKNVERMNFNNLTLRYEIDDIVLLCFIVLLFAFPVISCFIKKGVKHK